MNWLALFAAIVLLKGTSGSPAIATDFATLWVVQPPGEIVAFDLTSFSRVGGVRIPPAAFYDPTRLAINGHGQLLVQLDEDHLWIWDDSTARVLPVTPSSPRPHSWPRATIRYRQWLLGSARSSLYALIVESRDPEFPQGDSMTTRAFIQETDYAQRPHERVLLYESAPCQHSGYLDATLDPCEDPELSAPGGVIGDFFMLSHWEQAPHGPVPTDQRRPEGSFHQSLHRNASKGWISSEIGGLSDNPPMSMSEKGSRWLWKVDVDDDASNQTVLESADTDLVVFDEWQLFHNRNYTVRFYAENGRIAPDDKRVALTIRSSSGAASELSASAGDRADSLDEMASIRSSLGDLPIVVAYALAPGPALLRRLTHAELVGWASDSEILVVENHQLVAVNVISGRRRQSGISVRSVADAFVVRRWP